MQKKTSLALITSTIQTFSFPFDIFCVKVEESDLLQQLLQVIVVSRVLW